MKAHLTLGWCLLGDNLVINTLYMIVAATGHRPNKLGFEYDRTKPLSQAIMREMEGYVALVEPTCMITGMALGVDTLWALTATRLGIPFIAAVPFQGQEKMWPIASQQQYDTILAVAKEVVYVCEPGYAAWKMQKRNEWMVDKANAIFAVWDGTPGGTKNCVDYAVHRSKPIHIIDPNDLRRIMRP